MLAGIIWGTHLLAEETTGGNFTGSRSSGANKSLAAKAADPMEPLIAISFFNDFAPDSHDGEGFANRLLFQPVIPVPAAKHFPVAQIIRPSLPLITTPGPDRETGLGDLTVFDVFVPRRFDWGAWGAGPVMVLPTATGDRFGQGKWQAGPAVSIIYESIPHLQIGLIAQNPISFAGDGHREDTNALLLQPILQYNLPNQWYVSMGDFSWTFDWKEGGAATIPVALQVGRVVNIVGQKWNLAVEPFYMAVHQGEGPKWGIRFGITLLLPESN